jgi:hypothetical protein
MGHPIRRKLAEAAPPQPLRPVGGHPVRYSFAEPLAAPAKPTNPVLAWTVRLLNILVIGVTAWAMIETAAFLKAYVSALVG